MCNAHILTFPKPSLALCLSGRAELWLQTWQDEFQEAINDKQIFLLMSERETTEPHINRKKKVEDSEV